MIKKLIVIGLVLLALYGCNNGEKQKYNEALKHLENKDYDQALSLFEELGEYNDSKRMTKETKYQKACELQEESKFDEAIAIFKELDMYKDSPKNKRETIYLKAKSLLSSGDYKTAKYLFEDMTFYKDSADYLKQCYSKVINETSIGESIVFGYYEQDVSSYYPEEIEWILLEKDSEKALFISKYVLDCQVWGKQSDASVTWKDSYLRNWLNDSFYNQAFSKFEKSLLVQTEDEENRAVKDYIFVLSKQEAERFFPSKEDTRCEPTVYADYRGADNWYSMSGKYCAWWLKTPSIKYNSYVCYVSGYVGISEASRTEHYVGVRPAIWISLVD